MKELKAKALVGSFKELKHDWVIFHCQVIYCFSSLYQYKINEIVNIFLLAGDKFMSKMHLKQPTSLIVLVSHLPKTKKKLKLNANGKYKLYLQK